MDEFTTRLEREVYSPMFIEFLRISRAREAESGLKPGWREEILRELSEENQERDGV